MRPAGRQLGALLWKNWLCRRRHRVLFLAEFVWPCTLFMILTVLRFQEPPRHRDNCYLQPRDLPSAGVFPFVRGLLCNTGARCRNTSYAESPGHSFRFQARAGRHTIDDLVFLQEMQDLADEICEMMDKATDLKKVWVERSKTPGSSPGSGFPTLDLNKTEAVISKLESLQQQPQVWDFLRSLPRLSADDARAEDGPRSGVLLLRVVLSSLASLEDLDWLQLNPTFSRASGAVLNTTLSALTLLQGHGAATGPGYRLSLRSVVWDPPKVQADLKSRFGLDDLHAERVLNYSAELKGIPTDSSLEQMVCSVLSQTSEDEADREGHPGDCHARWSAASTYLVHAVSWPRVCRQVLQQVLTRAGRRLEALGGHPEGESLLPRWVVETLRAGQLLLEGIVGITAAAGPGGRAPPDTASPPAKEQQLMEKKLRPLEDERRGFLVSSGDLLEPLLLPNPSASSGGPTETLPNTRHSRVNRVKRTDTQKVSEFGQEMIEEIPSLEKKGLHSVLRFLETALSGSDPKPPERWTRGVPDGGRADPETSAARSDVSVAANEGTLSKSFNLSQLFHSDGPTSPAVNLDFVHLSETVINSLRELGFLRQEQVSEALDIVCAVRNASGLLSALSEPQRRDVEDILTHMHLDIFQDRDSALLLQICSLFYQYVDQFLGFQRGESPLSLLTRTSEHILELRKQFSFQNLSRAFAFLYETTELLGGISEAAPCQQLLSIFSLLELQTQSLMSTGVPELEVVNATLTGLRQWLLVGGDGRTSLFQYLHQLLRSSAGALLDNGCFALGNESASVNHSGAEGPPRTPPWAHVLANLSADGSVPGGLTAVHCTISWFQTWTGIWGSMAQMLKLDVDVLTPLHVSLTQLLGELESDAETSESCQGVFPIHRPARLIIDLLGNITQGGGVRDWDSFLNLRALWGALQDTLVRVKSLRWDQVDKSLSAMDTALGRLQAFLFNTRAGGEFLSSLLGVLAASGSASEHRSRHVHPTNLLLSWNLTAYEGHTGGLTADLRETILFLRNVSRDQDLLSCADTFQNMTELMLEGGSLSANTSQRALRVLATLNSSLFPERAVRGLNACIEWVGGPSHADATCTHGSAQGRLRGVLRRFREVESGLNSTLKLVTWLLNTMESDCVVHKSNINCVTIYLKNATDFLNVILAAVFEKEKAPTFEILLTRLNDSTDQVRMLISNLTRDFESASQSSWTHFIESSLRPVEMSGEIPGQFHNAWQHVVALGKDIQELAKDIFPALLENNVSSEAEKLLNLFTTSPKEEARQRLDSSLFHLARYLAFNLSHDLQNPRQTSPREILAAVSLGSQVVRDVLSSLGPSMQHSNPEDPGSGQVLKKAAAFLLALRKTDIDLLGDQLEQVGESLMDFLKNVSRLGTDSRGVHLLVGLMEKLADSFRSWNVNHLLRLSRLFPREDVDAVVGLYYALPHAARLLHRVVDENVTEALKDIYSFIVLHGTGTSLVTKEDLAAVMKTLLDTFELVSDKPSVLAEAATCLPVVWCRSHTTSGFQQDPELEACNGHFYSQVASILGRLHLSPRGDVSQCSNGSAQMEVTREMVCVVRELVDWGSFLLELSEVFRVNSSLLRAVQGWWRKVLPFIPAPGNQSTGSTPGLCPPGPMKQVAFQIIETFREVNFSKVASDENILETLATLNETLNTEGAEAALRHLPLTMERMIESLSGDRSLENSARSLVSLLVTLLNADRAGGSVDVLSRFVRQGGATHIVEDLWRESEQTVKGPNRGSNSRTPFSDISKEIPAVNPGALHNMTLQLAHLLGSQNSSSPQASEMTEGFLSLTKRWLRKYASEESSKMSQTLLLLMANESSTDKGALLTNVTSLLGYLKNISREGHSHGDLLDQEQPTNFSVVQLLLKSFLANSINNLAVDSHEAAWNLSDTDLQIMHFINLTLDQTKSEKGERLLLPPGSRVDFMERLLKTFFTFLEKESSENRVSLLTGLCRDVAAGTSSPPTGLDSGPGKPPAAVPTLVLRALLLLAEDPSWAEEVLCAALSRGPVRVRRLVASALQGVTVLHSLYQELQEPWSWPGPQTCARLSRKLASALEHLRSRLASARAREGACPPAWAPRRLRRLTQSLEKILLPGNSIVAFLGNFSVTADVKVKDLMRNVTELTGELRSIHISEGTIHSLLEADICHSQVLSSALVVALSESCGRDVLGLLLAFPEGREAQSATEELCRLPGAAVYALLLSMTRNLDLHSLVYKALMPAEANSVLSPLLDVVSRLSRLLPRASRVLEDLPEFLHSLRVTAWLDVPDVEQSVMKMVCGEQDSFLSSSNVFLNLPRVNELLADDREKFNIPEGSTPFCLKLYREILQSPNGALVWSFLKPILHGKILYTPNTPEINKVIQKANYTFVFVDKLRTLSETLLNLSSVFQSSGHGQALEQLQEVLRNKFVRHFVESKLHIDMEKLIDKLQAYGGSLDRMLSRAGAARVLSLGRVLVNLSSCVLLDRFQGVESVTGLEAAAQQLMRKNSFLASVIFNSSSVGRGSGADAPSLLPHVSYTIRTSVLYSMRTDLVKNPFWKFHPQHLPADGFKYNYIFVPLQDMIERAVIRVQTGQEAVSPAAQTQAIPYPCHSSDLFLNNVGFFFPLILMLTWMVTVASMVRKLVYEREIQMEEYLRMMGLHPATSFLAWLLENLAAMSIGSAALAAVLKASGIFAHSNAFIVFLFLLDFGVSVVMLSYFLSAFFRQANTAALCTSLVYMISFLPYVVLLVLHSQLSAAVQTLLVSGWFCRNSECNKAAAHQQNGVAALNVSCLLSTTAFGQGVFFITFLEGQEAGLQWGNLDQAPEQVGLTFGWVCGMILLDSGLYFLCGWYLSNLTPGTCGLRKAWHFPFTVAYWKGLCGLAARRPGAGGSGLFSVQEDADRAGSSPPLGKGQREGVTLVSVTKEYPPHKVAIRDLTLSFPPDQITALLGANGAGKTTLISLVTGLHPPTSGRILVNGKNLQTDLSEVRRELGVCPQRDVLFDDLTVREHLLLFASIKAPQWTWAERRQQVGKTLRDTQLAPHQHTPARALSGGLRRKLSIGAAFLGSSRTVVLDEPTSGVDPCSRRGLWDILLRHRAGRTIIFTTHHLDEAEALSDRVAVLQQGQLRCCDSPLGLMEAYGQGLSLTLSKQPPAPEVDGLKDTVRTTALVQAHVPRAVLKDSSGRQLRYAIPKDTDPARFTGLFRALEQDQCRLHLAGFGLADTTLEEVFLRLLQDSGKQSDVAPGTGVEPQSLRPPGCYAGAPARTLTQAAALLTRRLCRARRAWRGTLSHLLLPVLFVALATGLFMVRPLAVDYPPLKLTPGQHEEAETYFFSESGSVDLTRLLLRKFGDEGLLCADHPDRGNASCWHTGPRSRPEVQGSCGCAACPNVSAGPPYLTSALGHTLLNLSAFRLEEYLLLPSDKPRLGGWSFGVRVPGPVPDANASTAKPETLAKVWYDQKGFHSLPSYLNHLNNLILWRLLPPAVDWRQYGMTLYSHPYGGVLLNEDKILESIRQCGVALCVLLGFSVLSASLGSSMVRDRVSGAKRLQHISGLGYGTYWLTHFLCDMLFYLVSVGLCVAVIAAFRLPAFTFRENLAATALLLVLFGYATLPWMYLMSRAFSSSDVAFISYVALNFIFGLCTMLMTTMPRLLAIVSKAQHLQNIYEVLKWIFTIFPQFCLGQGLVELCYNQIRHDLTRSFGIDAYESPFAMSFLGWVFVQLASQGTVLLLLRVLVHWDLVQRARGRSAFRGTVTPCGDSDVQSEQTRVLKGRTGGDLLVLCNLRKSFGGRRGAEAVRDVSLGVRRGECFGLLGANGAGKSTTFKMLSGDIAPTAGHAVVRTSSGEDVALFSAGAAGVRVGYCPQQDALDELLTGWEHLRYYCSLRGIPKQHIPEVAGDLVRRLQLGTHVDKPVATYSGGTKRKLSTALALLGRPDLLLLDEPSSGMDPYSKRFLWRVLTEEVLEGCAVVLTSHSMEECEALCTRLAIMVNGSFRCLGSPQHLRDRFGAGYVVRVACEEGSAARAVSDCLGLHFPDVRLQGQRLNVLEYHVPRRRDCLADLFRVLADNKTALSIRHYSIQQPTLEQVFIDFAAEPQPTPRASPGPATSGHRPHGLPV